MASQDRPQTEPSSHQIHQCHLQALQVKWASLDFVSVSHFLLYLQWPLHPFFWMIKMSPSFWHYLKLVYFQSGKQRLNLCTFSISIKLKALEHSQEEISITHSLFDKFACIVFSFGV